MPRVESHDDAEVAAVRMVVCPGATCAAKFALAETLTYPILIAKLQMRNHSAPLWETRAQRDPYLVKAQQTTLSITHIDIKTNHA